MTSPAPLNAADLTARAYGRRKPRYPVIPETLGLAVVLLVNRNTSHERALWLTHPDVHRVIGDLAEAFGSALTGKPSPEGWRGGALASLRTFAGDALHEVSEPWPWSQTDTPRMVDRFWVDDAEHWYSHSHDSQTPVRTELLKLLGGHSRIEDAWEALLDAWELGAWGRPAQSREIFVRGVLASWGNTHERPEDTRRMYSRFLDRDLTDGDRYRQATK